MAFHIIRGIPVVVHELQSVLLISPPKDTPVTEELVQAIVREIVRDRDCEDEDHEPLYHIQEALDFDVFVRQGERLTLYSFSETGELKTDPSERTLTEAGLFHFQFSLPETEKPMEAFRMGDSEYIMDRVTPEAFFALSLKEQDKMLIEIIKFTKTHFPEHFELWWPPEEGVPPPTPDEIKSHFRHLISSLSSLYIIKDREGKIVAINGISATKDGELAYQSMTITRFEDRARGFMAFALGRATLDYPKAVMTAFFVNPSIRAHLGESAMTRAGDNPISAIRNPYLDSKLKALEPISREAAVQASLRGRMREMHEDAPAPDEPVTRSLR